MTARLPETSVIVLHCSWLMSIVEPSAALAIALRRLPGPESAQLVTGCSGSVLVALAGVVARETASDGAPAPLASMQDAASASETASGSGRAVLRKFAPVASVVFIACTQMILMMRGRKPRGRSGSTGPPSQSPKPLNDKALVSDVPLAFAPRLGGCACASSRWGSSKSPRRTYPLTANGAGSGNGASTVWIEQ